jgi:UDP-N-acetylglucosamine transferase subunit ALG13
MLVTVGSSPFPFDRLLRAVDHWEVEEELIVQHGPSMIRPRQATCVDFLSFDELVDLVRRARLIVMHAGVGSILTALVERQHPVVVPRRRSFGEAVDDHQLTFVQRAHELGLVSWLEDLERLPPGIVDHLADAEQPSLVASPIESELRAYLAQSVGPPAAV